PRGRCPVGHGGSARLAGLVQGDRPGLRPRRQGAVHRRDRAGDRARRGRVDRGVRPGRGGPIPGHQRGPRGLPRQRDRGPGRLRRPRCGDHRRRGADGRRLRLGAVPPAGGVPMTVLLSREQAAAAVATAVDECDTTQDNLLERDNSFGKRLLAGAALTGESRKRWDAVAADLTTLWQTFDAYSAVVDRAAELLAGLRRSAARELAEIS